MAAAMTVNNERKGRICVFCGSSAGKDPKYLKIATELGEKMAQRGFDMVYGGGTTGLMGAVALAANSNGSDVLGVIPEALVQRERASNPDDLAKIEEGVKNCHDGGATGLSDEYGHTTIVKDMHTRKRTMGRAASSGFIVLPGGYGTLEEYYEVMCWSQLGIHDKPMILLNVDGFYDSLLEFIKHASEQGFIKETHLALTVTAKTVDEALDKLENYVVPEGRYNLKWSDEGSSPRATSPA